MANEITALSMDEIEAISGGNHVAQGFSYAALGTVAVGIGLAVPTGGASLVAVGGFLTAAGIWEASF